MRNIINNEEEYECIKFMKKYVSWISMLQYRKGGDFLSPHTDNLNSTGNTKHVKTWKRF